MEIDFAVVYFGLTRSLNKVYKSHEEHIFNILEKNNLTYKKFMHTWTTNDGTQNVWEKRIDKKINTNDYMLINPDYYKIDNEDEFLKTVNINNYFYKHVWDEKGECNDGELMLQIVKNNLCALESQNRAANMIQSYYIKEKINFKYIILLRPDVEIINDLPLNQIILDDKTINLPNHSHWHGLNDQFAIMSYKNGIIYLKRIHGLIYFRKHHGRIVSEKYVKYVINKIMKLNVKEIDFKYTIIRP